MFNFFSEVKAELADNLNYVDDFNIVNLSGKLLYVEGHRGITTLSTENISFKVKRGIIVVEGKNLTLKELSDTTLKIQGQIARVEAF